MTQQAHPHMMFAFLPTNCSRPSGNVPCDECKDHIVPSRSIINFYINLPSSPVFLFFFLHHHNSSQPLNNFQNKNNFFQPTKQPNQKTNPSQWSPLSKVLSSSPTRSKRPPTEPPRRPTRRSPRTVTPLSAHGKFFLFALSIF